MAVSVSNHATVVLLLILLKGIYPVSASYQYTMAGWKLIILVALAGLVGLILLILAICLGILRCIEWCMPSKVGTVTNTTEAPNAENTPMELQSSPDNIEPTSAINPSS